VAYVDRSSTLKEILKLVETVASDQDISCAPAMTAIESSAESMSKRRTPAAVSGTAMLTLREEEVVRLIVAGHSNKEIAALLNVSLPTVKSHVHNLLTKLGMERRGKLALRFVVSRGPITGTPARKSKLVEAFGSPIDSDSGHGYDSKIDNSPRNHMDW
jgi:DNA-binding NarL/FixJ family response regulator